LNSEEVFSDPLVHDPKTGQAVKDIKSWLTDQAYTGGVGDEFRFVGPVTNHQEKCGVRCVEERNPWAAPGRAPSLGGGCGVFGGNPWGCPKDKDKRPPGSACGQKKVDGGRGGRGTSSFGTDARLFDFPQMITTEWQVGSVQDVAWSSRGGHWGGYTYRLCKVPSLKRGKAAITEECFTKNVLKFATNFTMTRALNNTDEAWEKFEQRDLREGTYPKGSVWRPVGVRRGSVPLLRKDSVVVPDNLEPGNYVLGWRWDGANGNQVWVSCASMKLLPAPAGRSLEQKDEELYTDEEYEELEEAFQN